MTITVTPSGPLAVDFALDPALPGGTPTYVYGDGASGTDPSHTYAGYGLYVVGVRVNLPDGRRASMSRDFALGDPADAPPGLASIAPSTAVVGGPDLTLTATGTGFTEDTVIVFNGGEESTTFVSATELTTVVQPSTASGAGSVPVTVRNGYGESAPQPFIFTAT